MKEIVSGKKENAYENLEEISMYIKKKMTKLTMQYQPIPFYHKPNVTFTPIEERVIKQNTKIKVKKSEEVNHYMDDIISQANIFEWAGITFNKTEWYKIRIAMKKLLIENNCEYIRFFGKIFGIDSDYYIMLGILKDYPMKNPPVHVEERGNEGINHYTFCIIE